jgi:hypothetical protein
MDQIYAKVKRLRSAPFRRVISGEKLFEAVEVDPNSCHEYSPSILLDDDEWYKVSQFSDTAFFPSVLKDDLKSADVHELKKEQFDNIAYLLSVQSEGYFFQRVRPSAIMRRKSIVFGDAAVIEQPSNRIVISPYPDAIYRPEADVLIFRDLAAISPIFLGIDELFREATDSQVRDFLDEDFISGDLKPEDISKPNRKRIALAIETLGQLSPEEKKNIFSYISEYCEDSLVYDAAASVFKVTTDSELKTLIFGIEQRFYTTLVGAEKRLANSIVPI